MDNVLRTDDLSLNVFGIGSEMIFQHLRLKDGDRWSAIVCRLKFNSFRAEFPEVNEPQFLWTCEQWLQQTDTSTFLRFPVWAELMVPLYRTENGRAARHWGPRLNLPREVAFSPQQLQTLPTRATVPCPKGADPAAYQVVGRGRQWMELGQAPQAERLRALPPSKVNLERAFKNYIQSHQNHALQANND